MIIEEWISAKLRTVLTNVYPNVASADAPSPFAIYQLVSTNRETVLSGPTGGVVSTFRVNVYAQTFRELRTLVRDIRVLLNGYSDAEIQYCNLVNELDLSDLDKEEPLRRRMLEFRITHFEQ